jgi:hypothetical protein
MRSYVANMILFPTIVNGSAYTSGAVTVFTPGYFSLGIASHEFTHILDVYALQSAVQAAGYAPLTPFSDTSLWQNEQVKDTAIPTSYAATSWHEDFADSGRVAMTDMTHPGGLWVFNQNTFQIENQFGTYESRLRSTIFPSSGVCVSKTQSTPPVLMTTGKSSRRGLGAKPNVSLEGTGIKEIVIPDDIKYTFVYHGNPVSI